MASPTHSFQPAGRFPPAQYSDRISRAGKFALVAGGILFLACAIFGGSARADVRWLLFLRPLCICLLAAVPFLPRTEQPASNLSIPGYCLIGFATIPAFQLVPLPPDAWAALPGHADLAQITAIAGLEAVWRPLSLTPWLTANTLIALLTPAIALAVLARFDRSAAQALPTIYLGCVAANVVLGIFQAVGAIDGPILPYRYYHSDSAIGFFTNRNHSAVFISTAFPVLHLWAGGLDGQLRQSRRAFVALFFAILLIPVILVTGSRAGMVVALIAMAATLATMPLKSLGQRIPGRGMTIAGLAVLVPAMVTIATFLSGRAIAIHRIVEDDLTAERRITALPINLDLIATYFPFGSGFGSFDFVFRRVEPDWALSRLYFNHAHNDLLQIMIEGSLPAIVLLVTFLFWVIWRLRGLPGEDRTGNLTRKTGAIVIGLWFLGSLTDYPLRAPLAAALFCIAVFWVASGPALSHGTKA